MRRLGLLALTGLLAFGCDSSPASTDRATTAESVAKRGRHRVRTASAAEPKKTPARVDVDVPLLETALLDRRGGGYLEDRDPFRYGPEPRRKTPVVKKPVVTPPVDPKPVPAPKREDPKPVAPPFLHTYLGSFGPLGLRIAVFEDSEGTILNAFEGEVLEGKFKVLKIGYESVDIEFVGFPDTPAERIPVGG